MRYTKRQDRSRNLPRLVALTTVLGTTSWAGTIQAQNAATLKAFATEKHLGTLEQTLVGVEVRDENNALVGWGSGFVLRCDGFVALPTSICAYGKNSKLHLTIVLYPGTEKETRKIAPWPYFGKAYRGEYAFSMGYTVTHLPNVHLPALRIATADVLHNGDTIKFVWTQRNEATGKFSLPQTRTVQLANAEAYPKDLTKFTPGAVLLAEAQAGVPAGAVVVGPEDLGVGSVLQDIAGQPVSRFLSFSVLECVTNCVSPLTMTDADFAKRHPVKTDDADSTTAVDTAASVNPAAPTDNSKAATDSNSNTDASQDKAPEIKDNEAMVAVPGGPIILPDVVMRLQQDMGSAGTACIAPFQIDKYEVTNRQYAAFWQGLPEKIRKQGANNADYWPYGWATNGPAFSPEVADVPVIGVRLVAAEAYAKWAGKRLPTPYEWCLAAFGPKGMTVPPDWVNRYVADRQQTWQNIWQAHNTYMKTHPEMLIRYAPTRSEGYGGRYVGTYLGTKYYRGETRYTNIQPFPINTPLSVPWLFSVTDDRSAQATANLFSWETIDAATAHLWDSWKEPFNLLPAGSRDFDKSPYGAMDMILNADELVMPGPTWPAGPAQIPDHYLHIGWQSLPVAPHYGNVQPPSPPPYDALAGWRLDQDVAESRNPIPDVGAYLTSLRPTRFLSTENSSGLAAPGYFRHLLTLLAIGEAGEVSRPVFYWKMQFVQGPAINATGGTLNIFLADFVTLPSILEARDDGDWSNIVNLWAKPSKHWRFEMGRMPSVGPPRFVDSSHDYVVHVPVSTIPGIIEREDTTIHQTNVDYRNEYVIAGGFRCAR